MFSACEFQYDGKSSSSFELKIVSFSSRGSGGGAELIGIPLQIEETKIKGNAQPFFFGTQIDGKLEFTIQIAYMPENTKTQTENVITQHMMGSISKWLFKREYKEFKIIDEDHSNLIYNCIFQNPRRIEIGNGLYGFEIDGVCDRPWGIRRQTITKTVSGSLTFNLKNLGYAPEYNYPEIEFTTSLANMSIRNNTDNNSTMTFTGLNGGETIYVNNQREEIISSTGLNRNSNFNFNWFKLTEDYYNSITITGTGTVTFRLEFPIPF